MTRGITEGTPMSHTHDVAFEAKINQEIAVVHTILSRTSLRAKEADERLFASSGRFSWGSHTHLDTEDFDDRSRSEYATPGPLSSSADGQCSPSSSPALPESLRESELAKMCYQLATTLRKSETARVEEDISHRREIHRDAVASDFSWTRLYAQLKEQSNLAAEENARLTADLEEALRRNVATLELVRRRDAALSRFSRRNHRRKVMLRAMTCWREQVRVALLQRTSLRLSELTQQVACINQPDSSRQRD
jgi:hypothetical protein